MPEKAFNKASSKTGFIFSKIQFIFSLSGKKYIYHERYSIALLARNRTKTLT